MATQSWSTRIRHDSDANFREWGSELAARFAAVGLIQTADTGQINWATVTRAAVNTTAGYEIWRFADAQQGTAPIFLRVEYGTGNNVSSPRLRFQVGTGSNGSGTLTGITSVVDQVGTYTAAAASDTPRQSYLCYADGFLGLGHKTGAGSAGEGYFLIMRTVDGAGVADARGAIAAWSSGSVNTANRRQAYRFAAPAVAYTANTGSAPDYMFGFIPQIPAQSYAGSLDLQVAMGWTIVPEVVPLIGVCGVYSAELSIGGTFSATLVGSTPRTYLTLPNAAGPFGPISTINSGGLNIAMLWE